MFKKVIRIELDERYFNRLDLAKATVEHLKEQGNECKLINSGMITLNGDNYRIVERNYCAAIVPVQVVELFKVED